MTWWVRVLVLASLVLMVVGHWLAAGLVFRSLALQGVKDMRGVWRALGVMMVGGLMMVAVFDLSPKQYEIIESQVIVDRAGLGERADEVEVGWWESWLDPKGSTLRERFMSDVILPEEEPFFEIRLLLRGESSRYWGHEQRR